MSGIIDKLCLYAKWLTGCKDKAAELEEPGVWLGLARAGQCSLDAKQVAQYGQCALRTLTLLRRIVTACRGLSLPVVPAHGASARGGDVTVTICFTGSPEVCDPGWLHVVSGCVPGSTHSRAVLCGHSCMVRVPSLDTVSPQ